MIAAVIRWSLANRPLVLLLTLLLTGWGLVSLQKTPIDALPDLSDAQVIIKTSYPGQAPGVVEAQVTYPLTTAMLSVPGTVAVRGYSYFGDSFVYVVFEDGTDLYWARSRVLEYLSQVSARLPDGATPALGPDASGVGWIYQYALVDRQQKHDLSQLRSIQDWFLKYELQTVPGVAEVATVGGMVRQYQVVLEPNLLRLYNIPLSQVKQAIQDANREVGGSVIEQAEAEQIVYATGYLQGVKDLAQVPLGLSSKGTPILLKDVAKIRLGPQMRRGIAELDGLGEVVGGIVVMRWKENARATIEAVKQKLEGLKAGLPEGVEIVETYDRSRLINSSVDNLQQRLIEEFIVVSLICILFLFHLRTSLIIITSLPVGILAAFGIMQWQGINANIMSLGGIAIAIGTMVDAAIVMLENVHKHAERNGGICRWEQIEAAAIEVGSPLFFSLVIITLSFLPVFVLQGQEGRLFSPLAYTKTYAMAAAAILSITLVPVLMGYFIRGRLPQEASNPINRWTIRGYLPVIRLTLRHPIAVLSISLLLTLTAIWPISQIGSEFMPELDEGDLMYMPTTFPGLSIGKAQELLQQTDRLIRTVPEVERVFGKIGRAETATDPAPLTMIETTITLKPKSEWREGMTLERLKQVLDQRVDGGRYLKIKIDRLRAARFGLNIKDVQEIISTAIGGVNVTETVEGLERYPVNIRYPRAIRDSGEKLRTLPIITPNGRHITLGQITQIEVEDGPPMIKSENARPNGWVFVDIRGRDLGSYVAEARQRVDAAITLPPNYSITWSGQYEHYQRANARLIQVIPLTFIIILVLLYLAFRNLTEVGIIIATLPFALTGGAWMLYLLDFNLSIAVGIGFIALAGIAVETAVVMIVYLNQSYRAALEAIEPHDRRLTREELSESVIEGAVMRVRPKIMTVASVIFGLLPVLLASGSGSDVMRPIAAPMVGGMLSAALLTLVVVPAVFYLWKQRESES
ncbi:efflux RND transporter permease subunit [endosymbiont of Ridgeia piscesae]|jgi:Cu(I)/Ag(I) efflux system membrane protein CusA/SilA|uniref:Cu(I)/Ag(I) efflux system membrane protein CusA/SilA n=1 Tax=endosymbiont of Ridgeia piscesae TaxID=54398 RepID=A0A0T5Z382_9GAMM|nr:CusA/CzcA family heavy metal efflux RND transporter [endosymbiont of Ridgeia piscesae]KRT55554.1 heavy metal efflux pump, CzcA family [endosymbiont of Ridgeia piscesae]KRT57378.1 Cu(I)/Ag(I) efflux system membrane protein CusA/SilA [endosymbiont of Ridgeia piscesae]